MFTYACTSSCDRFTHLSQLSYVRVQGDVASLEDLVRQVSSGNSHVILPPELGHEAHDTGAQALLSTFIVWRCSTFGGFVLRGTIRIAQNGVFLLSGKGAHFRDTTFIGAASLARCQAAACMA